jgi:hypothetical protein
LVANAAAGRAAAGTGIARFIAISFLASERYRKITIELSRLTRGAEVVSPGAEDRT